MPAQERTDVTAILASGPSMTSKAADAIRAAGVHAIVINNTWKLFHDANVLFGADAAWWLERNPRVSPTEAEFAGERIVCQDQRVPEARYVKPRPIGPGSNSALQAAYFAQDCGAKKLLLFGVDLNESEVTHWHGPHRGSLSNPNAATFRRQRKVWGYFARASGRPEVINCNPRSALECFPKMTPEEALCLVPTS